MMPDSPRPGVPPLPPLLYEALVRRELAADLGSAGDVTTDAIVPPARRAAAQITARRAGRVCGLRCALFAFELLGPVSHAVEHDDGADVPAGTVLAMVEGPARALLSAERTALNVLAHLSGVATAARDMVDLAARAGPARVVCTRKTTPGLRTLEKYAVRVGGASNHRFGLSDAVLVKDNHRLIAGGVAPAVARARAAAGHLVRVEVEVDTLEQLDEALDAGADAVLLDNFSIADLRQAAATARGRATTEASGGITPETVAAVAATGVDFISVGWITHSAPALDVGLDFVEVDPGPVAGGGDGGKERLRTGRQGRDRAWAGLQKRSRQHLTHELIERVHGVRRVLLEARRLWKNDRPAMVRFLNRPHLLLGGRTPLEVARESTAGADLVVRIIGEARAGVAV